MARQGLPPAFCSELLEETYGALRGWTPTKPQLINLCSGLMVKKLRMARTPAAAHGPCAIFASGIISKRADTQGPLPPLATLKVDWCGAQSMVAPQLPPQEPRRQILTPPQPAKQPHKQAFVNLDNQDPPKGPSSSAGDESKSPAAPLHVHVVHHGSQEHHHHNDHKPRDWESLTDRDALLRARDAILSGADDSAVLAAAAASDDGSSVTPSTSAEGSAGQGQKHTTALVGHHQAKSKGHSQGFMAASLGYISEGAAWAKQEMLDTVDFVCDGHCGIKRKPMQFEVVG
jgi:hypothetical protein